MAKLKSQIGNIVLKLQKQMAKEIRLPNLGSELKQKRWKLEQRHLLSTTTQDCILNPQRFQCLIFLITGLIITARLTLEMEL